MHCAYVRSHASYLWHVAAGTLLFARIGDCRGEKCVRVFTLCEDLFYQKGRTRNMSTDETD